MSERDDYKRGYASAMKDAVTWLHAEAKRMNDEHARAVLNSAAFHLGNEQTQVRKGTRLPHPAPIGGENE